MKHFKKLLFLQENPLGPHYCFFRCFDFNIDSYYCFQLFSLLIAFVPFITVSSGVIILPTFFFWDCFLCCSIASATDLTKIFLLSDAFYLKLLSDILHNRMLQQPAFIKGALGLVVQLAGPATDVRNTEPADLFV